MTPYRRMAALKTSSQFRDYLASLGLDLVLDEELLSGPASPLAGPCRWQKGTIGNRFAILPMEGWDGTEDGRPTDLTIRRWQRFGASGAKLVWGGEAVSVRADGRASPNQLMITENTLADLGCLREALVAEHQQHFGRTDDLVVGLQLTHSGRFARPHQRSRPEPLILYHHPVLDRKFPLPVDHAVLSDDDIERLVGDFVRAARLAQRAGFAFVDIKHCHGYLGHEFLSAVKRPGRYGGSLENRTCFLREVTAGIRAEAPGLAIGVRLSAVDWIAFRAVNGRPGEPEPYDLSRHGYPYAFGGDGTGLGTDLTEPLALLDMFRDLGIHLLCVSVGNPYANPHIQRPALFPPCDSYLPPEDPLIGVARQIAITGELKKHAPDLLVVGSGYSYLQEWLPHVGQAVVRHGLADFVGLGRMALAYPEMPADVLCGRPLRRQQICRTFSDCTTAPRNGMVSGCYPLDPQYKQRAEALKEIKEKTRRK
jgi:NADPH2 dehydrogenase